MKSNKAKLAIFLVLILLALSACKAPTHESSDAKTEADSTAKAAAEQKLTAGTYDIEETGKQPMIVSVTLSEDAITAVAIKEHSETEGICEAAIKAMPEKIVRYQSVEVDTIAGATMTSSAIKRAAAEAITQAGGDTKDFSQKEQSTYSEVFHLTEDSIPDTWDETYEVVIVGAGFSGLAAAHTAAGEGASTVIFEKMPMIGGNSKTNGGQYAAYTSKRAEEIHKLQGTNPDTALKHFEDTLVGGDNEGYPELIWNLVYGSPAYLDLMLNNGLVITEKILMPGGHYGYRTYVTENQIGYDIIKVQEKLVKEAGATIEVNALVTQIYRDEENGKVLGVRVETENGVKNVFAENGVILATGGFGANVEMREENNTQWPTLDKTVPTTNHPGATGDGILMGEAIGAQMTQMDYIQLYPFADPLTGSLDSQAVIPFSMPSYGGIYIDTNGKRYVNEGERRDVCAAAAQNSGGFPTFAVFDSTICDQLVFDTIKTEGLESGRIIEAATLKELAEKLNSLSFKGSQPAIDVAVLTETVEKFNGYLESGVDEDFGRVLTDTMLPIQNGPFYAVPAWPSVHHTMGGIKINASTQVLDTDGNAIPNLYAAGEITGGVHGTNRLGSNAGPDCVVHGWIAGQMAASGTLPEFAKEAAAAAEEYESNH